MAATRSTTGVHGLEITIWQDYIDQDCVDYILKQIFSLTYADFHKTAQQKGNKRAYDQVLSYKNQIFLYLGGRTQNNRNTVHLEIKGKYFDSGIADEEHIKAFCRDNTVKATRFDVYNDDAGEVLKFNRLWKQMNEYYFTSQFKVHNCPGNSPGAGRTIYFGTGNQVLSVYEKGVKHTNQGKRDYPLEYLRLEMQLKHEHADVAFKRWISGEPAGSIASGLIASQVEFKDLKDTDKNNARRSMCPFWKKYLSGVEACKLEVERKAPDAKNQAAAVKQYVLNRCNEIGAMTFTLEAAPVIQSFVSQRAKEKLAELIEILRQEELENLL